MSFEKKIARATELGLKDADLLSVKTADKHFGNLIEYWKWLQLEGLIEDTVKNPFTGYIKKGKRGKDARDERHQWPRALEQQLFQSPVWTGCSTIHRRARIGKAIFRDALFWLPILARTTGARQDELCSLLVEDVKFTSPEDFGFSGDMPKIAYLRIDESKTGGSTRNVPLHEIVLLLGFLEYRVYGRDGKEPLFPELIPQGAV